MIRIPALTFVSMKISAELLVQYGAEAKFYARQELICSERRVAHYFFQIQSGLVKMINFGEEHDFIQGIFTEGDSFAEPPMLGEFPYPASAVAVVNTHILALPRKQFIELLRHNFELHLAFTLNICKRIEYKSKLLKTLNLGQPEDRILASIDLLKTKLPREKYGLGDSFVVPFTRQDLADMTGLRVETVIRKVGLLAEQGKLLVSDRKILRPY